MAGDRGRSRRSKDSSSSKSVGSSSKRGAKSSRGDEDRPRDRHKGVSYTNSQRHNSAYADNGEYYLLSLNIAKIIICSTLEVQDSRSFPLTSKIGVRVAGS